MRACGVAAGRAHSMVVTVRGALYVFGAGGDGQLGLGLTTRADELGSCLPTALDPMRRPHWTPTLLLGPPPLNAAAAAAAVPATSPAPATRPTGATSNCSTPPASNTPYTTPRSTSPPCATRDAAPCGTPTTLRRPLGAVAAITKSPSAFRRNAIRDAFRLTPSAATSSDEPVKEKGVVADEGNGWLLPASGCRFSACVTTQRRLYTWGCGRRGELGHGRMRADEPAPRLVAALAALHVWQLAAGEAHCACLAAPEHGHKPAVLYLWGAAAASSAGGGAPRLDCDVPRALHTATTVTHVACGGDDTTFFCFATPPPEEKSAHAALAAASPAAARMPYRPRHQPTFLAAVADVTRKERQWSSVPLAHWKRAVRLMAEQLPSPGLLRAAERYAGAAPPSNSLLRSAAYRSALTGWVVPQARAHATPHTHGHQHGHAHALAHAHAHVHMHIAYCRWSWSSGLAPPPMT